MRLAHLFRLTAIGIALLCWLDPPVVVAPQPRVPVDVVILDGGLGLRPERDGSDRTIALALEEVADELASRLDGEADVRLHADAAPDQVPCDAARPCVLLTAPGVAPSVPDDRRGLLAVVRVGEDLSPNVELLGLEAAAPHVSGEGLARVRLRGRGVAGRRSRIGLYDGPALVGEGIWAWEEDGVAAAGVAWWPVAAGPRRIEARVVTEAVTERTDVDNVASVAVQVGSGAWPVVVHERRPSWATTFARRAIEGDPRFEVTARTDVAPRIVATPRGGPALTTSAIGEARVLIVGAPEALSAADVTLLEQFVRVRGGSAILVPDRAFAGPVTRLLDHRWRERLTDTATSAGMLRASEWLVADGRSAMDEVLVDLEGGPTVVSRPTGAGRLVVVGALDAWRHREDEAYRRFWRSTVAAAAAAAGPALEIEARPSWVAPGGEIDVRLQARGGLDRQRLDATVELRCPGGAGGPVRLWPGAGSGRLWGRVRAPIVEAGTACRVVATVEEMGSAETAVVVSPVPLRAGTDVGTAIESRARESGGVVTTAAALDPVIEALRGARSIDRVPEARHPMRSWWWLLPLVACLAAEWWLRRRAGLR